MKLYVLAVHDEAAEAFNRPIFVPAIGMGIRSFTDEVNRDNPDNPMNRHAGQFSLYRLGVYDDVDGSIISEQPSVLVQAIDVLVKQ